MTSPCGLAPPEDLYPDLPSLYTSIQAFACVNGYAFATRTTNAKRVLYTCDRAGSYRPTGRRSEAHSSRQRQSSSKRCGCNMRVIAKPEDDKWRLTVIEATYNHNASSAIAYPVHRVATLSAQLCIEIVSNACVGIKNNQILSSLSIQHPEILFTSSDITNITQAERLKDLGGRIPIQWLLWKLKLLAIHLPS
ncbi:hypothetical protein B7463_g1941, partial [Scytalidium lignicola]